MSLSLAGGLFFRDTRRDAILASILPARKLIIKNVSFPRCREAGLLRRDLLDPQPLERALNNAQLATAMNVMCSQLAAMQPIFRFHALREGAPPEDQETFRGLHVWNAFTATLNSPSSVKKVYDDALNYAVFRLLGETAIQTGDEMRIAAEKFLAADDDAAGARGDLVEGLQKLRGSYHDHLAGLASGKDQIHEMLDEDDTMAVLMHGVLESAAGFSKREARLACLSMMETYTVPLCSLSGPDADPADTSHPVKENFQALLRPLIQTGAIGGACHAGREGDRLVLSFEATQQGAREAAKRLAPHHKVFDAGRHPVSPAAPLVC